MRYPSLRCLCSSGRRFHAGTALVLTAALTSPLSGQDSNILFPVQEIETLLLQGPFDVASFRDTRAEGDRTQLAALKFETGALMNTKWAVAPVGGEEFNNAPRYEVAAYEIQKLFLEQPDYVVPPTIARCFPVDWFRELEPDADPTFSGTRAVLVVLQYWLWNVEGGEVWDKKRFREDEQYARHMANLNVLTYLIRHSDSNVDNILLSADPENPRVFAVDNGVSFRSEASTRGTFWRKMRVDKIPSSTAERLRAITPDDLRRSLATLYQFEIGEDGALVPVEHTQPLGGGRLGVRREGNVIQLGLTSGEINDIQSRLEKLIQDLDEAKIGVF